MLWFYILLRLIGLLRKYWDCQCFCIICQRRGRKELIKTDNIEVFNFNGALRGMRNPLESWDKSDSYYDENKNYIIGEEDMKLALKLVKSGTDHSKFMRQIFVCMDIYAPEYWWKEYETYQVGTTENSTSTMHKLTSRLLTKDDFSWDKFELKDKSRDEVYHGLVIYNLTNYVLDSLNDLILKFQQTNDKRIWRAIIQGLPMSFNYLRTCTMNYQVLRNMYFARRNHRLQEWKEFCKMIEKLPYNELITIENQSGANNDEI